MSVLNLARIIVYRFHEKGLAIFLLDPDLESNDGKNQFPAGKLNDDAHNLLSQAIEIETENEKGGKIKSLALEGEWHDIPSIRSLIKQDVKLVKSKIKEIIPESEQGGFIAFKETFKKLLPEEYKAVKELKEILVDRNLTKYI